MRIQSWFFIFCFVLISALSVNATAPTIINYQGKLMQPSGTAVPDGTYAMKFAIYDAPSDGILLWSELNPNVTVKAGLFNVLLGSVDPTGNPIPGNIFDGSDRFFGVTVGADPEMTPRQKIASVAYAQSAANGVPVGGIIMWSGAASAIPQGWALCDGTKGTPNLQDRFIVGAGSGYAVGATGGAASIDLNHHHAVPAHQHAISSQSLTANSAGSHSHEETTDADPVGAGGNRAVQASGSVGHNNTGTAGAHSHSISGHNHSGYTGLTPDFETGITLTVTDIRPPYYALCFIMRTGN